MISCCSTACTFDEPDDGADIARREIRLIPDNLSEHTSGSVSPNVGQAPWLAGSSCTQKYCSTFGYRSSVSVSRRRGSGASCSMRTDRKRVVQGKSGSVWG